LFLHVWLKRQDQKVALARVFAQGFANAEHVGKAFQTYLTSVYPFAVEELAVSDKEMLARMQKEVEKGAISFSPIENNILRDAAKKYTMSDEDVKKLRGAANKRKGLK
jgi:hypothetical protein